MNRLFKIPAYSRAEMALMRLGLAALIVFLFPFAQFTSFDAQPHPRGFAQWLDLSVISRPEVGIALRAMMCAAALAYVFRRAMVPSLGVILCSLTAAGTLANSQGGVGHGTQILTLVVLGQTLAWGQAALQGWTGALLRPMTPGPKEKLGSEWRDAVERRAVFYGMQLAAASYVISGITKIQVTDGRWIRYLPNLSIQIIKTHAQEFYSSLGGPGMDRAMRIAEFILAHPNLVRVVLGVALYLEVFAFVGLANRRMALLIGSGLVAMHLAIDLVMSLTFSLNILILLIFFVNLPYLMIQAYSKLNKGEAPVPA